MSRMFKVLLALLVSELALMGPVWADFEDCTPADSLHVSLSQFSAKSTAVDFGSPAYGEILGAYGSGDFFAEYVLSAPCEGSYQVELKYAAAVMRPLVISLNGAQLPGQIATGVTGGWTFNYQRWFAEPQLLRLRRGANTLRLASQAGEWPHVSEVLLTLSTQRDDVTGVWRSLADGNDLYYFHQDKGQVTGIYVNPNFSHLLRGSYTTASEIRGTFDLRIHRQTGCATRMDFKIRMTSPDAFQLKWQALDSNCDLQQGQESYWLNFERVF